jgi:hypothetical protein
MKCKIICDEKEVATIDCSDGKIKIESTDEGKKICKKLCGDDKSGCCGN